MQTSLLFKEADGQSEQLTLPDANLSLLTACFPPEEARTLFDLLLNDTPWQQEYLHIAGKRIRVPRLQAWYGDADAGYAYSGLSLKPLPWTGTLNAIRQRVEQHSHVRFNSVLLNYYRDGNDSVAWHADDEPELGPDPVIASVSLGCERHFQLKHRQPGYKRLNLHLGNGSLLIMGSGLQRNWVHRVPKQQGLADPRINLTFRLVHTPAR